MQAIAESELIINSRGAIYHLDLRPEELASTIFTVGDPDRVSAVSKHFDSIEHKAQHREFVSHTGYIGKKRLTVVSTGIGTDNIDIVLNELDALANIDLTTRTVKPQPVSLTIIRMGTSGALQKDVPIDSFVASTHGLGIDNLLNFYRHDDNEEDSSLLQSFATQTQLHHRLASPYISGASPSLLKYFVDGFHQGITVTCPGFYGPQGRVLRLGLSQPELIDRLTGFSYGPHRITNFEMETAGIYGLGRLLGHHCLSLSAIVANRISRTFSTDGNAVIARLIKETLDIVEKAYNFATAMSKMHFYKYQGTGNDFIILDNRNWSYTSLTEGRVKFLCDRRFGIGADGLMLLNTRSGYDFEMKYYNSDGRESSMCGNGGRCLVKFAYDLGIHKDKYYFIATDGPHQAEIDDGIVRLKMKNVTGIREYHNDFILNTGSPHYVKMITDVMDYDVFRKGMEIRYSGEFAKEGINVNFVEQKKVDEIIVRTYERGVEDETLSCGTGVTASALACYHNEVGYNDVRVITKGGKLRVEFDRVGDNSFENIWLCGPAVKVFEGEFED